MGSRVGLFAAIRRDERVDGLSIRELARRHGVHRRTVRRRLRIGATAATEGVGVGLTEVQGSLHQTSP